MPPRSSGGVVVRLVLPAALSLAAFGQPRSELPEYVQGDECLFCHRNDIGPGWQKNAHGVAVRQREDAPDLVRLLRGQPALAKVAPAIGYFLGNRHRIRFLRKDGYGRFALLSTQAALAPDGTAREWIGLESAAWDRDKFGARCAGCHATAVDAATRAFSAFGLDCYTCHGVVPLEHSGDTSLVWLSKKRRGDAQAVSSICAQCHLRGGRSQSTGLPYPKHFVAGDKLFDDFEVDWKRATDPKLNPGDRHAWRNAREVALEGSQTTCLSCHSVHGHSTARHRRAPPGPICLDCHFDGRPRKDVRVYTVRSELCEY